MSDYQYLLDYPVTVENAEEWCGAMAECLGPITWPEEHFNGPYQGSHRADEEI
jgi:hypothetical protein